jgi:1,4-dihydroxy-6-naphthoate synthase
MKKCLTIGFSPCPNDTFIFDAMVHGKIDTEGYTFSFETADVETLNALAIQHKYDLTKLSFFAYPTVASKYQLLHSGSALGSNCGPLLISKNSYPLSEIPNLKIAIPGVHTTANFLLSYAFPDAKNKTELVFSDIENAVISGRCDAGVIIHENRFTYMQHGLRKLLDLGEYWETQTGHPIPLGGIAIKRELHTETRQALNRIMKRSIVYALQNPESSKDFVIAHAQEMQQDVMKKHIELYVNHYTESLGTKGTEAINFMYSYAFEKGLITQMPADIFV